MSWLDNLHSANWNQASVICLCAYMLGCFAAGYYLVRMWLGEDIRELGSGSVGARNVGRFLGKTGFLITLLSDFGKGSLAIWMTRFWLERHFSMDDRLIAMAMIAVVAGHIWPAQLRFHGGKGMATTLGALVVYDVQLALTFGVLFLCLFTLLRRTVLPGLFALACLPLASLMLGHDSAKVVLISISVGLVLIAHRKNLVDEIFHLSEPRKVRSNIDQS